MWLGEQITKRGVGNGISIIIFASILSYAPTGISGWLGPGTTPTAKLFFPIVAIGVVVAVVFVMEGQRRIPVQYARRQLGGRQSSASTSTYMPLSVIMAGVIPIIFARRGSRAPADDRELQAVVAGLVDHELQLHGLAVPAHRGDPDLRLHVLLHVGHVQPGRPG